MWSLVFERSFQKSFRRIHSEAQSQIGDFLEALQRNPRSPVEFQNFLLLVNRPNQGRFRFGKYRVGVTVDSEQKVIYFNFVGARGDFYKQFR